MEENTKESSINNFNDYVKKVIKYFNDFTVDKDSVDLMNYIKKEYERVCEENKSLEAMVKKARGYMKLANDVFEDPNDVN